ncbi:phage major capsid protein [Enterobacter cloacae]|uniref:phage major capsid family protein n=1 Tax=Enterobacter cloacae TaxID=550 RepID=UPI0020050CF8|nr:phage major capsid protein [Enterobacter cloacae]MCK7164552.1 phage major capsid protein [Enterobacter cloacae]
MEIKQQKRELTIPLQAIDIESQTIDVAFCSENPVERVINGEIYYEILLCGSENADLRRLNNNGAVLFNHNHDELIGAVVSARMDADRVGRATLKISSTANDEWEMIKEGVLTHISIGYNINDYRIEGNRILVTSYEIFEVSLVSIPADVFAGVGRSMESSIDPEILNSTNNTINKDQSMEDDKSLAEEVVEQVETIEEVVETEVEAVVEAIEETVDEVLETISERELELQKEIDVLREQLENKTLNSTEENDRVRELNALGQVLNIDVSEAIEKGISISDFKRQLNDIKAPNHDKDINKMENKNLLKDMVRAIKTGDKSALEAYERGMNGYVRAVVPATNTTTAAGAVADDLQDQYIPELLKLSALGELNTTVYSGLAGRGNLSIPKAAGVAPVFKFYGEAEEQVDSIASFTKVTLTPKAFGGAIPLSKQAILTAPNIEQFVQSELMRYAAQGLEQNVMDKIVAAAPVHNVATAGTITLADVQAAVAKLAQANVDMRGVKAVMNAKTLSTLRQIAVLDNTAAKAMVEGYRNTEMWLADEAVVVVSEFVADGTILLGDFSNVIIANWENSEYDFDDTTYRSSNTIVYRLWDYSDIALAHAEAFVNIVIGA